MFKNWQTVGQTYKRYSPYNLVCDCNLVKLSGKVLAHFLRTKRAKLLVSWMPKIRTNRHSFIPLAKSSWTNNNLGIPWKWHILFWCPKSRQSIFYLPRIFAHLFRLFLGSRISEDRKKKVMKVIVWKVIIYQSTFMCAQICVSNSIEYTKISHVFAYGNIYSIYLLVLLDKTFSIFPNISPRKPNKI